MNRDFINIYMQEKNIPSGYLKAWYNFDSGVATGSAGVIYNQIHNVSDHYYDTTNSDGDLKSEILAGISIGDNDVVSTPGLFDYKEMIQISDEVDYDNWTVFFDIDSRRPGLTVSNQQNLTGKAKIFLSSMDTSGDTSGFHIGLNGYNHPFMKYVSSDGLKYEHTFSREVSDRSLLSFSFSSDGKNLSIGKHSPNEHYLENFITKPIVYSNTWTIGGFKGYLNNSAPATDIRAFDGTMNHFMLFNPSLKGGATEDFSDFLFINNYEKPQVKQREVETLTSVSGSYITSGVVGTGITGYEKALTDIIDGIPTYVSSGVTGEISGDIIKYPHFGGSVISYESYLGDEVKAYDASSANFFNKTITFLKNTGVGYSLPKSGSLYHDSTRGDITKISDSGYEVRRSEDPNKKINQVTTSFGLSGLFLLGTGIGNRHINLYKNGFLQKSGTIAEVNVTDTDGTGFADYSVLESRLVYSNNRYKESDFLTYEVCDLPNVTAGYDKGDAASFITAAYTNPDYLNIPMSYFRVNEVEKDCYFGGIKLMSGIDYFRFSDSTVFLWNYGLDNGVFSWVEAVSNSTSSASYSETGHLDQVLELNNNLMDEIVWLSGIRQRRDTDYIKTANFSVLNAGFKFDKTPNNFIIYSGETGNFNK